MPAEMSIEEQYSSAECRIGHVLAVARERLHKWFGQNHHQSCSVWQNQTLDDGRP
jgi:hypothetical protein